MSKIKLFLLSEDGPTAVEYAVMLGLILVAVMTSITLLGQETATSFSDSSDKMKSAFAKGS